MTTTDEQTASGLPELLDVGQVAAYLGLHPGTVIRFARRGELPGFKVGREWRFRANDIRAWLEQQRLKRPTFVTRFDQVWAGMRERVASSGGSNEDVPRLIEEVRRMRASQRPAGA